MMIIDDSDEHFMRREAYDREAARKRSVHELPSTPLRIGVDILRIDELIDYMTRPIYEDDKK